MARAGNEPNTLDYGEAWFRKVYIDEAHIGETASRDGGKALESVGEGHSSYFQFLQDHRRAYYKVYYIRRSNPGAN